jgi:hypothetical protein
MRFQVIVGRRWVGPWLLWCAMAVPSLAYTPESPVVKQMVARGIEFLKKDQATSVGFVEGARNGVELMRALALLKATGDTTLPRVIEGVEVAAALGQRCADGYPYSGKIHYEASVAILLLLDFDRVKYRTEIQNMARAMLETQKEHGGFGYQFEATGDTSQVQYVMLALWSLYEAGFDIPTDRVENCVRWLLATQDPNGAWGYQGSIGSGGQLVSQSRINHSMATAGLSSLLIGGDLLGFYRGPRQRARDPEDEGLPPALYRVRVDAALGKRRDTNMTVAMLEPAVTRNQAWFAANAFKRSRPDDWYYYMMYGRERAESFLELARGRQEKEPAWYNQGVEELQKLQAPNGAWGWEERGLENLPPQVCTSFAILYLIRSTRKSIGDLNEGLLAGGYGLPKDTANARLDGNMVVGSPAAGTIDELLGLLEGQDAEQLDSRTIPEDLKLSDSPEERRAQVARLSRLVRGGPWSSRRVAARLLGQSGEMSVVPVLVYALSDPDASVRRYAADGLRFISRNFEGFPLTAEPTDVEIATVQEQWRKWYRTLYPGYVFLDDAT